MPARGSHISRRSATAALAALALTLVAPHTAVAAEPGDPRPAWGVVTPQPRQVTLPMEDYGDLVVDGTHGKLFLSDPAGGAIVVTDFRGTVLQRITGLPGAAKLALAPDSATLYTALPGADTIAAVSTTTHAVTARYTTGEGTGPSSVVVSGKRLWFGYGDLGAGNIGSVDLTTAQPTVRLGQSVSNRWYSAPSLYVSPADPGIVVAGQETGSPTPIAVYDVRTGTAREKAYRWNPGGYTGTLSDLAFSPDGRNIVLASGSPYHHQVLRTADLADAGQYPASAYPNSVAVARTGAVAAGVNSSHGSDVFMYKPGTRVSHGVFEFASGDSSPLLLPGGLGWAPESRRLFAVTQESYDGAPVVLRVLTSPGRAASDLALYIPSWGEPGVLEFSGSLRSDLPIAPGTEIRISRRDPGATEPTALPSVKVDEEGDFGFTDRPVGEGLAVYTATFGGDTLHLPSVSSTEVQLG
ncbi:YncE family protein [Streptomyces sp. NPDC056568]|uniref:YncE family protein n=1 Tax=Streptomyces sp. NPDC056568 TaxID=3345866 RepID=UPI00368E8480